MAHFNLVQADMMTYKLSLHESNQIFLFFLFSYLCPNKFLLHHKYAKKRIYEKSDLQGSFVAILRINEVRGTCKTKV